MLPLEEIARISAQENPNAAKKILANEATSLLHGEKAVADILNTVEVLEKTAQPFIVQGEDAQGNALISTELMVHTITKEQIADGPYLTDVVQPYAGCSKNQLRRVIRDKGLRLNGQVVEDEMMQVDYNALAFPYLLHIRIGKKQHILIQVLKS